jgi:hypothetical protein
VAELGAIALVPLVALHSPLALILGAALFITGIGLGITGFRHGLRPLMIFGYAVTPASLAAPIGNAVSPSNEWMGAASLVAFGGLSVLVFLPSSMRSSRIRHLGLLAGTVSGTTEVK